MNMVHVADADEARKWTFLYDMGVTMEPKLLLFVEQIEYNKSKIVLDSVPELKSLLDALYTGLMTFILATPEPQKWSCSGHALCFFPHRLQISERNL